MGFYLSEAFQCNRPVGCADRDVRGVLTHRLSRSFQTHCSLQKTYFPTAELLESNCSSHSSEADSLLSDAVPNKEAELYSEQLVS